MLLARRSPAMARVCNGAPSRNRAARNERLSMHPSEFARATPDKAAIIMAGSGQTVTFAQFEARSNQGAHLLRGAGLQPGGRGADAGKRCALSEITCAAHRAGLYFVCLSTRLAPAEIAYILQDSGAQMLIASGTLAPLLHAVADAAPPLRYTLGPAVPGWQAWEEATAALPTTPIADERAGIDMLYSSGTTGRPKGIKPPLPADPAITTLSPLGTVCARLGFGADTIYLNPAPLYHAAPLRWCREVLALGGTVVIMEKFDPEAALALIERHRVTHSQWVPTHFVRMLKLPEERAPGTIARRCAWRSTPPRPVRCRSSRR
jgi:acyl-CoA synthetase (AMP-forming)/AMP-acid ligase II